MKLKKAKLIYTLVALSIGIVWFYFQIKKQGTCQDAEKMELNVEYNGIMLKKYIDKSNHLFEIIEIGNKNRIQKIMLDWDESGMYEFVEIGDSIVKELNTLEVKVFRKNAKTTFIINYGCSN